MRRLLAVFGLVGLLSGPAAADIFHFSTGDPDGLIATAARPGPASGVNQETESADDFTTTALTTTIDHVTFTGLLPAGVNPATDISQVVVEIYRVFPKDSDTGRTPNVPTRANSPSDIAFDSKDSGAGQLTFSATLLNANFTAANSVDVGIHPSPNQTTGGEGAVSGQEVRFDVNLSSAFSLTPDHYFFVPQVLLSNPDDHFLWLSAPKTIPAPQDLQSWIRNDELAPDWLRVGTDVVGAGAFNASFSLDGQAVPEPSSVLLLAFGSVSLLAIARGRRRLANRP